jgi:hypothetical protein
MKNTNDQRIMIRSHEISKDIYKIPNEKYSFLKQNSPQEMLESEIIHVSSVYTVNNSSNISLSFT